MMMKGDGINRMILRVLIIMMLSALTACVTTETGGVGDKANRQQALSDSLQLARSYIQDKNWDAAKRHLRIALEIDDDSAEIYEGLALVFQNTGELNLAEENYEKAIRLDPGLSRVRNNYAVFLYQQKRYQKAAEQLEVVTADTLYRNRTLALVNLGRCYYQMEDYAKAESAFKRAHLMDRNSITMLYELANVYFKLEEYSLSQQYYDTYRSRVRQQPPQALWLGIQLAVKFDNQDALSSYALALKNLYPTSKEYLEYKGAFDNE